MPKKKSRQSRSDRIEFPRAYTTDKGYIQAYSIVTRTGVFKYLNEDGTIRRELRHPDDVFKKESLDTLRMIPITLNHPHELVDAENAMQYQKGSTGDNYNVDGEFVMSSLTVHHKDAVDAVDLGQSELSLGYEVVSIDEVGEYNGEQYDSRQTEIEYNHLAIVDRARAGKDARIKMDSGIDVSISSDVIKQVSVKEDTKTPKKDKETTTMKSIVVDGIVVRVEDADAPSLESAVTKLTTQVADGITAGATLQAKVDSQDVDIKKLKEDLKTANSDSKIAELVASRVSLEGEAKKVIGDEADFAGKTDAEVKAMAVVAFDSEADVSKGEAYVSAYFDIAVSKSSNEDGDDKTEDGDKESKSDGTSRKRKDANTKKSVDAKTNAYDSEDDDRNAMMKSFAEGGK